MLGSWDCAAGVSMCYQLWAAAGMCLLINGFISSELGLCPSMISHLGEHRETWRGASRGSWGPAFGGIWGAGVLK